MTLDPRTVEPDLFLTAKYLSVEQADRFHPELEPRWNLELPAGSRFQSGSRDDWNLLMNRRHNTYMVFEGLVPVLWDHSTQVKV